MKESSLVSLLPSFQSRVYVDRHDLRETQSLHRKTTFRFGDLRVIGLHSYDQRHLARRGCPDDFRRHQLVDLGQRLPWCQDTIGSIFEHKRWVLLWIRFGDRKFWQSGERSWEIGECVPDRLVLGAGTAVTGHSSSATIVIDPHTRPTHTSLAWFCAPSCQDLPIACTRLIGF